MKWKENSVKSKKIKWRVNGAKLLALDCLPLRHS